MRGLVRLLAAATLLMTPGNAGAQESAARQSSAAARPSVDFSHGRLRISDSGRFLVHADGTPFFYLGDTAWELFHRLTREETIRYLDNRRALGFTVIQAVVLAEFDGLTQPNAYGALPLADSDPTRPDDKYFEHVDWVVDAAAARGLYVGMLPTWGDKVYKEQWGVGPEIFSSPEIARTYARFVGRRYRDRPNIIWINGGDRRADTRLPIWRALGEGLRDGDGGAHLITYHPMGGRSSAEWFHADRWLDFNMFQSGHAARDIRTDLLIERDYARTPAKPVLDGEPRYEDHPINWDPKNGWFDDADVRQAVYWSVFAGGAGVTYGCHDVWQMLTPERKPVSSARTHWHTALEFPGARQVGYLRRLIESRPMLERVPDQSMIEGEAPGPAETVRATRGWNYAFVYIPTGRPVSLRLGGLPGDAVRVAWFDPRTGETTPAGTVENRGIRRFEPPGQPGRGNDWVLVLDGIAP